MQEWEAKPALHPQVGWKDATTGQRAFLIGVLAILAFAVISPIVSALRSNGGAGSHGEEADRGPPTVENAVLQRQARLQSYAAKSGSRLSVGTHMTTTQTYVGCRQVDDSERFTALIGQHDQRAAMAFASQTSCMRILPGRKAVVEGEIAWRQATCMRPFGEPFCLWVPTAIIQ